MIRRLVVVVWLLALASPAWAQLKPSPRSDRQAPTELAPAIGGLLAAVSQTVVVGGAQLEFWWVKELAATGNAAWNRVPEGAVVGVVRVTGPFKEIRGKTVKPGVYTLRYGLQPQNGDHLGASPFREHLLLSPAAVDTDPKPLGFDGTIAISKQTIGASHPAALSIDPPAATAAEGSEHTTDLEHKALIFQIKTAAGPLKFGLVLIGIVEH